MDRILERLLSQAYLFDDPGAYEAGVRDAAEAFARQQDDDDSEAERIAAAMRAHPAAHHRLRAVDPSAA